MSLRKGVGDQLVCNSQMNTHIEALKIASGAITIGANQASIVVNGTGDYTITFNEVFERPVLAVASCLTKHFAQIAAQTASSIQVKTFTDAGVAANADFNLIVVGFQFPSEF